MNQAQGPGAAVAVSLLCSIGVLIHEDFLLLGLPSICALNLEASVRSRGTDVTNRSERDLIEAGLN
jgi:hypothetical protein